MRWTIPNILTVFRLLAAPALGLIFLFLDRPYADWVAVVLFISASLTDYIDGDLARRWNQVSKFGAMLDPIADKAMVVMALAVLLGILGVSVWLMIPVVAILFREVFVSGLREFLGDTAGTLKVTPLAKWKTAVQMVAIALLFAWGLFEHYFGMQTYGMDGEIVRDVLGGVIEDEFGLIWKYYGLLLTSWGGLALLWLAAGLTLVTGVDYFLKAMPHLRED
ncbi:CDP-diacylglycerol--glycerol-3-phosphate 3-phosphatidyltransferase [Roseobacter sp. HKCCD9010]|jgi:CDP-diacylglycerol--glycerol-3-phosphate 3-phosphatidyltransferase|uniref:CDP-diacylglycerol--glycerol-3-phosphate 3-phosphatidyltransferase n=1 Tax=Rhodobacterales TaxID=204455 RepID=UPI0011991BF1|nr:MULTISPECIES: CDP-diacylglycerol--glycerol-3-phosphate 3-phosphatidyltransferase [Rhodobacterales]MBF9048690.1 CDP-diacylglycerol--glycerol-3-phosphate 3-phosphatidyltransferase [Rhodobacterales bacterium HKCCD4356]NNV10689.1 CDP-diacylglycerol--glycerol-3-phosphate 3-phosphatidyltransferase [Roseobacter sp. HKCCD7357]NNV14874.1 CDP-diacylglycerol--glycerol-3-phosphate 3-phosphatidyltransferase [Roseobacter sp. HKCCD8768]NNV24333.1 CDP-diacylglycerol--glycerol-3-phosphate 3-phosphatidyltrans